MLMLKDVDLLFLHPKESDVGGMGRPVYNDMRKNQSIDQWKIIPIDLSLFSETEILMLKVLIAIPKKYNIIPITRNSKALEFEKIKNNSPTIKNKIPAKITFFLPILSDNLPIKGMGMNCTKPPIVMIIPVINIELVRSNTNGWYTTLNIPTPKP